MNSDELTREKKTILGLLWFFKGELQRYFVVPPDLLETLDDIRKFVLRAEGKKDE